MRLFLVVFTLFFLSSCKNPTSEKAIVLPPVAKKVPKEFKEFENTRVDDYFWMNDATDSNVIHHLQAENTYAETMLKHTEELQKKLYDELVARIEQQYETVPFKRNGYWYFARYATGKQYPAYFRKKDSLTAQEEPTIDINELAKGHQIYMLRGSRYSHDNNWLAYGADTSGDRRCTVYFLYLNTRVVSPEAISNTSGDYAWANDNKTFYYTLNDRTVRSYKLMRHIMGTDPKSDKELYTEKDSTFDISIDASQDNRYIFINSQSTTTSEIRYIDANNPKASPVLIQPRTRDLIYDADYVEGNVFHIRTNHNAKNFKLVSAPIASPGLSNWKDVIPHNDSALLEQAIVLKKYLIAQYASKGLTQIRVKSRTDSAAYDVDFGEEAYVANMSTATDAHDLDSIRYSYTSMTTPPSQYSFDLASKKKTLLKEQKVPGYDKSQYETKRLWAKATDGTMVPISLVYKKSLFKKDGSNPLFLYAYGSYGYSTDPTFARSEISLLDRGFVYAIAHIRGGQEMGRYWYEDGKLLKKKNTFTDFVDCAQYLVNEKYTEPDKLFANGASAGGMLMGAVINMRPDLFRGVIPEVPWMDVITDMFNADLPLTTLEYDEWGDPHKKEYYDYMLSWSPYDNVKKTKYPAILATGGLNDTQVPFFSPAKWVQRVRENNTGSNPILFQCNMGAGHSGESGRFEKERINALMYAFMLDQLGAGYTGLVGSPGTELEFAL